MDIPERIVSAAQRLKEGHRINRITVRDFLRHFGAERRGAVKIQSIRNILDSLDLETDPDFETAWIDGPLRLRLKSGSGLQGQVSVFGENEIESLTDLNSDAGSILESTPSAIEQAEEQVESAPTSTDPDSAVGEDSSLTSAIDDPTFRIGRMPAANKKIISVNQGDSLMKAVSLLLKHDFSQLPVMQGEREVKGVVTWKSIGSKVAMGCTCETVVDCREDVRVIDSNRTLFDAIPTIVEYGYVLVRDQKDRKITGIVAPICLSPRTPTPGDSSTAQGRIWGTRHPAARL